MSKQTAISNVNKKYRENQENGYTNQHYSTVDNVNRLLEEYEREQREEQERRERERQQRLNEYSISAISPDDSNVAVSAMDLVKKYSTAYIDRQAEERAPFITEQNQRKLESQAREAGVQANAGKNGLTPYQVFMQAQMSKVPEAPVKAVEPDTRTDRQLFNDYLKQTARANTMDRMATDYTQGVQGRRVTPSEQMLGMSNQGIQERLYDPTYTSRLSAIGERMEAQRTKADKAAELHKFVTTEKKLQKEREKYLPLMDNPDFLKNSHGSQAVADAGMATATGSNAKARLYRDIYYRGTAGIDGKGVTDSAARNVNDEEAAMFFYLWNTQGSDAAETYYNDYVKNRASQRQMEMIQDQARAYGEYDPIGASVRSVGTQLMSGVGLVDMAWQNISRLVGITSASNPLNYYSPAQSFGLKTDAYREGASDYIVRLAADELERAGFKNPEKYAKVAGFLYQTGMSMADSGVSALLVSLGIPEPLTLANMGTAAGTRAIRDARERGATDGQALAFGISSAIMEALFEKISMDKILEPSYANTARAHIWNAISQSFTEGSEEFMTTLANTAMDQLIMGDKSELFARQRELMEQGVSEKEALKAAFGQWGTQVLGDFLGGLISGAGMGGIKEAGYAAGALRNNIDNSLRNVDIQNMINGSLREMELRQQYEQQNNPAPQMQAPVIESQKNQTARQADPLGYAMNKVQNGETLTGGDARAILENPQALQALRDAGVLEGNIKSGNEGRQQINAAVEALAQETAQEPTAAPLPAQENAQQEERVNTPPVPRAQENAPESGLRITAAERQNTPPVPSRLTIGAANGTLNENRQEANNGQTETTASSEAERARKETADFRKAANEAAGSAVLDRAEWRAGLGRLLQAVRNSRTANDQQQRRSEANRITNQAEAGNPDRLSANELGVADGSDEKLAVEVVAKILGPDAEEAVARLAKQGVTLRFISGQMRLNKLDANGKPVQVRAYVSADRKNIVVQADNPNVSWQQLLAHEELHRLIKENPSYRKAVMDALLADKKVAPYLSQIIDRYAQKYHAEVDAKMTDEKIIEEMLADYRAGFDLLDPWGTNRTLAKVTKAAAKDIRAVERKGVAQAEKEKPTKTISNGEYSIEVIEGKYMPVISLEGRITEGSAALAYLESLVNEDNPFETVLADARPVYLGAELPGEYMYSDDTYFLSPSQKKAKMAAVKNLDEMLRLAEKGKWFSNVKEAHNVDAANGWYRYDTEFAIPELNDNEDAIDHYNIYGAQLLLRLDEDETSHLYDLVNVHEKRKAPATAPSPSGVLTGKNAGVDGGRFIPSMAGNPSDSYDSTSEGKVKGETITEPDGTTLNSDIGASDAAIEAEATVGVALDSKTESANPGNFSIETWNASDYVQNSAAAAADLAEQLGVSNRQAKKYINDINSIAKIIANDRVRLDYTPSPNRSSFIGNTEYGGSIDFSAICKKRRLYTGTIEAIQKALPNTAITADELLDIRAMMKERGYEVSCGLCYVEGSRVKIGEYTQQFLNEMKGTGMYVPTMAEMNTSDGQETLRAEHPEVYDEYVKFMNKLAQRKPKLFQMATEYQGEILKKFKNDGTVDQKNRNGGLRLQSFSDFEIIHLIDTMQVIMDMSRVGLAGQAYTKVPDFAWALGDTGLKINLSLIAKGVDADGHIILDEVEGMKRSDAEELRNAYSKNVGTILVTFNDEQLKAAMADPFIDFIIPFHRSQWSKAQYDAIGLPKGTKDYTDQQNESYVEKVYNANGKPQRPANYMPNNYWDFSKTGKENAEAYLRMCAENNRTPKFYKLLVDNGDGSFSLQKDGSTDGYWKLLSDFKMYDNSGKGSPQLPVKPKFNMEQAERMLNEYTGGHQKFPVAQDVVDDFLKGKQEGKASTEISEEDLDEAVYEEMSAEMRKIMRGLQEDVDKTRAPKKEPELRKPAQRASDEDYTAALEDGDIAKAQRLVRETADAAMPKSKVRSASTGELRYVYHYTNKNFYEFRPMDQSAGSNRTLGDGYYVSTSETEFKNFGKNKMTLFANITKPFEMSLTQKQAQAVYDKYFRPLHPNDLGKTYESHVLSKLQTESRVFDYLKEAAEKNGTTTSKILTELGFDGVHDGIEWVAFKPEQLKSADVATYNDDGQMIPLSERFNPKVKDTRYSIEIDPEVAAQFSPEAIALRQSKRNKGVKGERKVSRVRSNTYEYSGLFNEVEAQMDEADEENYTYDPVSEKKSMNEALGRLKADFDGEVSKLSEPDYDWGGSDLDTAMGILHRYRTEGRATGDYSRFWDWSKTIQEHGTKGGQFIQAFAKYTRTGTGAAMKGAKDIHDRFKLNPAQQKQVDAAKKKLMDGIEKEYDGAASDAMKQAKGQKEPSKKQDGKVDKKKLDAEVQRRKDAERLVREIGRLFNQKQQKDHGEPVENWLNLTGEELARKIAGRFSEPKQRTKTTMQTILSDLVGFAEEHALPDRKKAEGTKRTAIDTITDYLANRDAYGTAWAAAQSYLRAAYTDDQEKLEALNSFLGATIAYNAEGTDRTMLDAILQSADVLGISEKRILELTSAGATNSTIDRIGDELVKQVKERMGADYDESFTQQLKDAVRRHITGIALQESAEDQRLRLGGMTTDAARQLDMNLQKLLTQSRGDKNKAAQSVADYLIRELDIPSSDAAIAAERITGAFMDELASRADRKLQQMFAEKKPKTQEQRDRLLDLIRLGGLTNSNVEDAVVDALGIGGMSRERQRELVADMARFGETLDAMEDDDAEGLRQLIREQAAARGTKLSRLSEKTLSGETDIEYLRDFALAQLASIAGDFENRSAGEMISTYQTISHLLNMRTALRNVTSNQVFDLIDSAANNVSMLPDMVLGLMTGKRTVGLNKSWASQQKRQGAIQGAKRNALEVNLDVGVDDRQKSKYGTAGRRTWNMANSRTVGKILSHLEEAMGYELNTTDEFHKGSVMGETLESLARFVDRGDMTLEEAQEFAKEMALYRSFQDDSLIGTMLSSIKDALNLAGVGEQNGKQLKGKKVHDFGLGDFVTKYTQVPGALVHRAIEFSPLGYAKAIFNLGQLANARRQGYETNAAQRKAALAIGRATTGTGLITFFAALAKAGLLRRDEDEDKNAKAAHQAQGLNGTQLNLTALGRKIEGGSAEPEDGDILIDINFLEPLDALMGLATLVANEDERNLESIWNDSITAVWDSISSLSMMQTLRDAYNVYQYYDDKAEDKMPLMNQMLLEIASSSLSGFIPSPVRQLAQATDTTYRDQYRSKKISDQMRDKAKNSIPGLRQTLAPKITPLGEDKKYEKPLLNYLNATLNPGNISVYKSNKIVSELERVYDETENANIWPERNAPYSFTVDDQKYTLTPDERTQYQRTRGQTTEKAMSAVMDTGWYKSMRGVDQAEVLNWIGNFSNFVAKKEMMEARGEDYGSNTYNKYYEAWQSGTPIEEVVADKYGKLVKAAEETAAAETIIAEAKIPEASKQEADTMSAEAKRYYAGFLQGGVSDETARKLATEMEGSEASGHEQWRMVYDAAGKEGEKAVTAVMTDDMKRNWNLAKDAGVSMDDYIKVRENYLDLDGNGKKKQAEWNATLDSFTFSTSESKDKEIKGTLWQILTGSESTKNNPYDKEAGQKVIDAKSGGGKGTGSNAPARIPTLRLPEAPKATKPSSGLRLPATNAAPRQSSGLRLK